MLKLKNKLFDVLARNISIENFEQWLYNDVDILNVVDSNDFVLELVNRNYSNKHIFVDLEKLCFDEYSKEEYLVYAVESTCSKIIQETDVKNVIKYVLFLDNYYNWDDDYQIIYAFYGLACDFDLVELGHMTVKEFRSGLKNLASEILDNFKNSSLEEKINILKNGMSTELVSKEITKVSEPIVEKEKFTIQHQVQKKKRKWFEFWK